MLYEVLMANSKKLTGHRVRDRSDEPDLLLLQGPIYLKNVAVACLVESGTALVRDVFCFHVQLSEKTKYLLAHRC